MGSKSGSSGGQSGFNMSTSTYTPNPQAMAAYNRALNMGENVSNIPYQPYQGQMIAGFTPDQMAAFQGVRNLQGYAQPYINAGVNLQNQAIGYSNPANYNVQSLNQYYNPYQQDVINAQVALMRQQNAAQQSQLLGQANQQAGGARFADRTGIAQAALARQQALANNAALSQLQNQGFTNAVNQYNYQQQQAIQAAQQGAYGLGQLGLQGQQAATQQLSNLLGTGQTQQQLAQQQLSGAYQQYLNAMAYPYQQANFYAGIASGIGPSMGGTTNTVGFGQGSSQSQQTSGGAQSGMGLLSSALSFLPMLGFSSDEREKTDIKKLKGTNEDGLPLYAFRYKGDPKSYPKVVGPMAQDVQEMYPEDVVEAGGRLAIRPNRAVGGASTGATSPTSGTDALSALGLGSSKMNVAAVPSWMESGTQTTMSPGASSSQANFGNIGYTSGAPTGLEAIISPTMANQIESQKWVSPDTKTDIMEGVLDIDQEGIQNEYADGGRVGYAGGGNALIPGLERIYSNPLVGNFGSLMGERLIPYSFEKLAPIQARPTPHPQTDSDPMKYVPRGGGSGGGGGGGGGGAPKLPKAAQQNVNRPLPEDASAGGDSASFKPIIGTPEAPSMAMAGPSMGAPSGESVGYAPLPVMGDNGANLGVGALPQGFDPLMFNRMGLGGFADGGRVGYAAGGVPAADAPGDMGPMSDFGAAFQPNSLAIAGTENSLGDLMVPQAPGSHYNDLLNQWRESHTFAPDPTPESKGFPSLPKQTALPQQRVNLPGTNSIETAGLTNQSNAMVSPALAVLGGGGGMGLALAAQAGAPGGLAAGAPGGGRSGSELQSQRDLILNTPQPAAGYFMGNLSYDRMTPEGLWGTEPVGFYTEPLYAKGGAVKRADGGRLSLQDAVNLLYKAGASPKEAAQLASVVMPESRGNPAAHNPNWRTGDNSYGLWQINMLGNLGPARMRQFGLSSYEQLKDPLTNAKAALAILRGPGGINNWSTWKSGDAAPYVKQAYQAAGTPGEYVGQGNIAGAVNPADMAATGRKLFGNTPAALPYTNLQPINDPTSRVADNSRYIAQPVAQRRGLSLADFNPIGRAEAGEMAVPVKAPAPVREIGLQDFGSLTRANAAPVPNGSVGQALEPIPAPMAQDNEPRVPIPPRRPAGLVAAEEPDFLDQISSGLGSIFGGDQTTVASDNVNANNADWRNQAPWNNDPIGGFVDSLGGAGQGSASEAPSFDFGSLGEMFGSQAKAHGGTVRHHFDLGGYEDGNAEQSLDEAQQVVNAQAQDTPDFFSMPEATSAPSEAQVNPQSDFGQLPISAPATAKSQTQPIFDLGGLFEQIGSGLGELFGVGEAQAADTKPHGGAPSVGFGSVYSPETGMVTLRNQPTPANADDQLFADHRRLTNQILTAPNELSRQSAQAALRANEFEINQRRLAKQQEMMYSQRQNLAQQKEEARTADPLGQNINYNAGPKELLESIEDPRQRSYLEKIAKYETPMPTATARNAELIKSLTSGAQILNPNFDPANYKTAQQFNNLSGATKPGMQILSAQKLAAHGDALINTTKALDNYNYSWMNKPLRWIKRQGEGGDAAAKQFDASLSNYINEYLKVVSGKSPLQSEIKTLRDEINENSTPAEIAAWTHEHSNLATDALNVLLDSHRGIFGDTAHNPVISKTFKEFNKSRQNINDYYREQVKKGVIPDVPLREDENVSAETTLQEKKPRQDNAPAPMFTPDQIQQELQRRRQGAQ